MTALATAPAGAPWAPPVLPLSSAAKLDRLVRLGAGIGLRLGPLGDTAHIPDPGCPGRHRLLPVCRRRHGLPHRRPESHRPSVTVIASSLTWADIDATTAYVHGRDAAQWLQTRPIRSALVVWADGTTTRLPQDPISSDIDRKV